MKRRTFIKGLAGASAAAILPSLTIPGRTAFLGTKAWANTPQPLAETRLLMGTFVTIKISGIPSAQTWDASAPFAKEAGDASTGNAQHDALPADREAFNRSNQTSPAAEALEAAFAEMKRLESLLTRHADSPLAQLNLRGAIADAPPELAYVVKAALLEHRRSGGAFDPTILPLLKIYERHKNPQGTVHPDQTELRSAQALVSAEALHVSGSRLFFERDGMELSLDGIAKGYIADAAARILQQAGIQNFLIDAGGDIIARGDREGTPWRIAVANPEKTGNYPAVCALRDQAIATSGSYEARFDASGEHHHLIDPATGASPALRSVSVIAPTAMEADALATSLSVMPKPLAFIDQLPGRACCIIQADGSLWKSARWPA